MTWTGTAVLFGVAWAVQFVVWLFAFHRAKTLSEFVKLNMQKRAELEAELSRATTERDDLIQTQATSRELLPQWTAELGRLKNELGTSKEETEHERRRVKNLQGIIASVVDQRQFWAEWYHRQAAEHGAAQNLLTAEVERLAFHVKQLGGKAQMHPALKELAREFGERHPALADDGQPASPDVKPLAERKVEGAP